MKKAKTLKNFLLFSPVFRLIRYGVLIFSGLFFFSCGQEPIFYEISLEVELIPPRISGTPTNMAVFKDKMYVAGGSRLFQYSNGSWDDPLSQPPRTDRIISLAATDEYLYALTGVLQGSVLYRTDENFVWEKVTKDPQYPILQTIYGDKGRLFAGAQETAGDQYAVLYDENGKLAVLQDGTGLLKGAVWDGSSYLLAVFGDGKRTEEDIENTPYRGIFKVDESSMVFDSTPLSTTEGINFAGIIRTGSGAAAVSRDGAVYSGNSGGFTPRCQQGVIFTGGLTLWEDPADSSKQLLLLGVQGGTGTGGYREIVLSEDPWTLRNPGDPDQPSSILNFGRYHSTIANHPVNYIFQVPRNVDDQMIIFASTQKDGFWSFRERSGEKQWNRES
jgi:hypothetical protein